MRDWVLEIIENLIDSFQFGSVRGYSTAMALIEMVHSWLCAVEKAGTVVRILFLDFCKAFDCVDHSIILTKLRDAGVPPILMKWLTAFLCQRQRVKIKQSARQLNL